MRRKPKNLTIASLLSLVLLLAVSLWLRIGAPLPIKVEAATDAPVSYWNMNETSGSTVADTYGTNTGTATGTTIVNGQYGKARSFNGTSDLITITDSAGLGSGTMTIESWVYPKSFSAFTASIYNRRTAGNVGGATLELANTNGGVVCYFYIGGSWRSTFTSAALTLNTWSHVACTYDGTTVRTYINGVADTTTAITGTINNPASPSVLIGKNISDTDYWNGYIDEVMVYNYARTAAQITTDMRVTTLTGTAATLTGDITAQRLLDVANTSYFLDPAATGNSLVTAGTATIAGNIAVGQGKTIRSAFGPLTFQYKSNLDNWLSAMTIQDSTGRVGMGAPNPAPVAWWQMDEGSGSTAADSAGSNTGTATGTTIVASSKSGYGNARSFNGTTDVITLTTSPTTGTGSFSIFAWIKTSTTGARQTIIAYGTSANSQMIHFYVNASNKVEMDLSFVAGPTSAVTVTDGNWHHVGVINNAGSVQIYVDGVASGSSQAMSPNIGTAVIPAIGKDNEVTPFYYFNGTIDDVRVYNYARTQVQVNEDMVLPLSGDTTSILDLGSRNLRLNGLQAIGTTTGSTGNSSIFFWNSTGTKAARFDTATTGGANSYGTFYLNSTNTTSSDLAEYYVTGDSTLAAGDVVGLSDVKLLDNGGKEIVNKGVLRKTEKAYAENLIGVISTSPGVVMGSVDSASGQTDSRALALSGRAPVKIDPDSAPIAIGDFLTSSNKPGLAQKATQAGYTLGRALEVWTPSGPSTIEAFISPSFYLGDLDSQGNLVSLAINNLNVTGTLSGTDQIRGAVNLTGGTSSVWVAKNWQTKPAFVTVTPTYDTTVAVTNLSPSGFTILVGTPAPKRETIFWQAWW